MTDPAHLSGPRHLDNFILTQNLHPPIGTLQKRIPTLTRMATNQTAGPLRVMPAEVNHASEVIFQDYHFRNKVFSAAATPEEKKS